MEHKQLDFFAVQTEQNLSNADSAIQKIHLLALSRIRGIGFQTLRKVFERYRRLDTLWALSDDEIHDLASRFSRDELGRLVKTLRHEKNALVEKAEADLRNFKKRGIDIAFISEPDFPKRLSKIPDPPYWLFVEGNRELLTQDNLIAVVGTRTPSFKGLKYARQICTILSKYGFPILSGLAEGIDEVAHQTSVDQGNHCIAVLGTGISVVFPSSTAGLRSRILQCDGAVITEYLPNDSYSKRRFIQRNRIQAAISRVVIPVEWSEKGGTAHTIRYAEKYGRPVIFLSDPEDEPANSKMQLYTSNHNRYAVNPESPSVEATLLSTLRGLDIEGEFTRTRPGAPMKPFRSVLDEFIRLADNYDLADEDFAWLIDELKQKWTEIKLRHDN